MNREKRHKHHRHSSAHQSRMRWWTILIAGLALGLFATVLYCVNRWLNPAAV